MTRVLFIDQGGQMAGGGLSLLDIATDWKQDCLVALFTAGPLEMALRAREIPVTVIGGTVDVRREHGILQALTAGPSVLRLALKVARLARRYDLIYANSQKAMVLGAIAATLTHKPMLWHLRDILNAEHFSRSNRWIAKTLANAKACRVIANSAATAAAFIATGGDQRRVIVVLNGIDSGAFDAVSIDEAASLRRTFVPRDVPLIGCFSRISRWKGQIIVLEALVQMPAVHGIFVGAPLFGEEDYEAELYATVARLSIGDRVHFLGFRTDLPVLMKAVDIVVHVPIAPEPFGRVLVEGMLAGRPVITTRAGGALEIIEDGVSGSLIPPVNSRALVAAIGKIFADRNLYDRLAETGRVRAQEKFSLRRMLVDIRKVIDEVGHEAGIG